MSRREGQREREKKDSYLFLPPTQFLTFDNTVTKLEASRPGFVYVRHDNLCEIKSSFSPSHLIDIRMNVQVRFSKLT